MDTKPLDEQVEKILATNTVSRAQEIMTSRRGLWLVGLISFIESASPIPVITDPFIIAAILLNRTKYLLIVLISTVTSIMGGVVAFYMALFFMDIILNWLSPNAALAVATLAANQENTFVLTLIGAFTPVPYTLTAWAVGALNGNIFTFILASLIGRGGRYLILGWLTYRFGPLAMQIARRYIGITSIILILAAGLFFYLKM
jgi:membrane protein YqaA with SNARE-associated domain